MGNATSSVAEIKKKGDEYNKAVRRERALSGMPGLSQQMSSKRFKKDDPYAEQWKVCRRRPRPASCCSCSSLVAPVKVEAWRTG